MVVVGFPLLRCFGLEVTLLNLALASAFLALCFFLLLSSFSVFSSTILQDGQEAEQYFFNIEHLCSRCYCQVTSVVSDSVRPHRGQPTRLPHPWDLGCHFLLQCMKEKSESEVAQLCLTLATPWTAAYQAPLSMGFSRQKYWSGVPLPSLIYVHRKTLKKILSQSISVFINMALTLYIEQKYIYMYVCIQIYFCCCF